MAESIPPTQSDNSLTMRQVIRTWWPLAASWLLMSIELPAVSAIIARLADPEVNLAAYGGVVFPLALIIESPIVMLLAASTALSKDWESYVKLRRFMMRTAAILTGLHLIIALTPLYDFVVEGIINVPPAVVGPARLGLIIMTPWTWSIAFRRFNQGVLIRFDASHAVGVGTAIRLASNWAVLAVGYFMYQGGLLGDVPGIAIGTAAVSTGVLSEALYVGLRVRPVIRDALKPAPPVEPALTFPTFMAFYIPLALTSLLNLVWTLFGSMGLSRMPLALSSLAAWPVMNGLSFMFRSPGVAYNEVVVALLDRPRAVPQLRRFALYLALGATGMLLLVAVTPLAMLWLRGVSALSPELAALARPAVWLLVPLPALVAVQNWYQGAIVVSGRTRGITEAIALFLGSAALVLVGGVLWKDLPVAGLYVGLGAFTVGVIVQTVWLWFRSRPAVEAAEARDHRDASTELFVAETPAK